MHAFVELLFISIQQLNLKLQLHRNTSLGNELLSLFQQGIVGKVHVTLTNLLITSYSFNKYKYLDKKIKINVKLYQLKEILELERDRSRK